MNFFYFALFFSYIYSMDSFNNVLLNNTKKFFDDEGEIFNLINDLAEFIDFNYSLKENIINENQFFIFMPKRIFIYPKKTSYSFEFLHPVEDFIDIYYVIKNPLTENLIFYFCKKISSQGFKKEISFQEYREKLNLKKVEDTKFFYYSKNQINFSYEEIEQITIFGKAFKFKSINMLNEYNKNVEKTFIIPKDLLEDYKECKIDPKIESFFKINLREIKKIF